MYLVYWIKDHTCTDVSRDGYVGITNDLTRRQRQHKKSHRWPEDSIFEVLSYGTLEECLKEEKRLRPKPKIGWNSSAGGTLYGSMKDKRHTTETKSKMSESRKKFYKSNPEFRECHKGNSYFGGETQKGKKKPPGHSEKLRAIAKSRRKQLLPDGSWTWRYV